MLKKTLIVLTLILLASSVIATVLLQRIGIKPSLWFSMPEQSSFHTDSEHAISISLEKILDGFSQITDFQFFPDSDSRLLLLQKSGELYQVDIEQGTRERLLSLDVLTQSEQGLLGVAIHPQFPDIPCIYLNRVINKSGKDTSEVSEWCREHAEDAWLWYHSKTLFELEQPYKNHNAGHLIFDRHGLLYIPWGDGGSRDDPHGHGQNLQSYLGTIIRIDPLPMNTDTPYAIPEENPFLDAADIPDEIYAYGFRNPWKLAFDHKDRLIAADVGQDAWEEIGFVKAGGNHGWNRIEALHCFQANCSAEDSVLPFIEYGHDLGRSVTGGYVYQSRAIPQLYNKYIYGDFVSGRLWAAELPQDNIDMHINTSDSAYTYTAVFDLGQWPLLISSFAHDHSGRVYLADFARGQVFRITPAQQAQKP